MNRSVIDIEKFTASLPFELRDESCKRLYSALNPTNYFRLFFKNPGTYFTAEPAGDIQALRHIDDLFQSNFYVIDFLLSLQNRGEYKLLDWGCGMGLMIHYLNLVGVDAYGYDSWKQCSRDELTSFLRSVEHFHPPSTDLCEKIINYEEITTLAPDILSVAGIPNPSGFFVPSSVKYLIVDSVCSLHPSVFEEFEIPYYWRRASNSPASLAKIGHWKNLAPHNKIKVTPQQFDHLKSYTQVEVFKRKQNN